MRLALALLVPLMFATLPASASAQDGAGRIARAIGHAVETLSQGAQTAVSAFSAEFPVAPQAAETNAANPRQRTIRALAAVGSVAVIGFILAVVVLVSAQEPLEAVARAAERDISASFWAGLLWQALAIPIVLTLSVLLAVTIILIPAIPIAMLAWALVYAGSLTLGLFAVTLILGRAILNRNTSQNRSALLSCLLCGLGVLTAVWLGAAFAVSIPIAGILARLVALALTWVAATVGLGAVVRSRVGTRREDVEVTTELESAVPAWQTPTPVFGVVAARRPTPVSSSTSE
ncbi:MAG: hypothetical protein H7Z40_21265 [Phycisphaerae bacterium]|nr:hypothetical protein [Gemmatimonadaceae bacterium]